MIRAIWPSFLNIPNSLPESSGITTNEMIAHFVFWSVQFPILLTPPHKLKWFFMFKTIIVPIVCVGTVITMVKKAGGTGEIWNQSYRTSGSTRSWTILNNYSSVCGGWYVPVHIKNSTHADGGVGLQWQLIFLILLGT